MKTHPPRRQLHCTHTSEAVLLFFERPLRGLLCAGFGGRDV